MASKDLLESLENLRSVVLTNLKYQHYWTDIRSLDTEADFDPAASSNESLSRLPRPLIHGRPPEQLYNPEPALPTGTENTPKLIPDMEYVLPVHLNETFTLRKWAVIFDTLPTPTAVKGTKKRIVVAVVSGDSTVVYYIMHDGIVKPRQN